jgi:hypothetical protein
VRLYIELSHREFLEKDRGKAREGEVSIFYQSSVYKYYSIKMVSLPPIRKS